MRSIATFLILAILATTCQAAVERFPLNSPEACVKAYQQLYVDGEKNGWQRKSSDGVDVFIKDGYVGYFASYATDGSNCVLQSETVAEFQARIIHKATPKTVPTLVSLQSQKPQREEPEIDFWDTGWGTTVKVIGFVIFMAAILKAFPATAALGKCDYTWQTASDGSRCGNRAAIVKAGGKF